MNFTEKEENDNFMRSVVQKLLLASKNWKILHYVKIDFIIFCPLDKTVYILRFALSRVYIFHISFIFPLNYGHSNLNQLK